MPSEAIWIAIITASPLLLAHIGKSVSYVIDQVQDRAGHTIKSLQRKIKSLETKMEALEAKDKSQQATIIKQARLIERLKKELEQCP